MSRVTLKATDGMICTNGESYGRVVYLGTGDSPDNWHEITETEYEHKMKQEEKQNENLYQSRSF